MGYRLYYCKTYKKEYADNCIGNYCNEGLNDLIEELCPYAYYNDGSYSDSIEIGREELQDAADKLYEWHENGEETRPWMDDFGYSYKDVADFLEDALENADKGNDYVRFEWF